MWKYLNLVYSTQVNRTLRARSRRKAKWLLLVYIVTNKVTLLSASYSACVVYTKTVIHLSVGATGGYLPPLRWIIIVNSKCTFRSVGSCLMHCWTRQFTLTVLLKAQFNRLFWQLDGETRRSAKCILQWTRNPLSVRTICRYGLKTLHLDPLVWEPITSLRLEWCAIPKRIWLSSFSFSSSLPYLCIKSWLVHSITSCWEMRPWNSRKGRK